MDIKYSLLEESIGNTETLDDLFLFNLYFYFVKGGYYNIVFSEVVHLIISFFLFFFINFLITCVNFDGLFDLEERASLGDFVDMGQFFNMNGFIMICFILYLIYALCKLISIWKDIDKYRLIRDIYTNKLHINDDEMSLLGWNGIVDKIVKYYNHPNLNVYTISNRILKKENIIISLFDADKINIFGFTKLLEWNFIFCFINPMFNTDNSIRTDIIDNRRQFKDSIRKKLTVVSICNLLFLPFILFFMCFYIILKYGEQFYNKPELVGTRKWTLEAKWKLRNYNELSHFYYNRLKNGSKCAKGYIGQFENKIINTLTRLIVFIVGSFFLALMIITFINENLLIKLQVSQNKPILWYLGIFGTILAIIRKMSNKKYIYYPSKKMKRLRKYIPNFPSTWETSENHKQILNNLKYYYQNKVIILLKECLYMIAAPYLLFQMKNDLNSIVDFNIDNIENHYIMGNVTKFSVFTNINVIQSNRKTQLSFINFKQNNPNWSFNNIILQNMSDTITQIFENEENNIGINRNYNPLMRVNTQNNSGFLYGLTSSVAIRKDKHQKINELNNLENEDNLIEMDDTETESSALSPTNNSEYI